MPVDRAANESANTMRPAAGAEIRIDLPTLGLLIDVIRQSGWQVIGPTIKDGAISYEPITGIGDLPAGWTSEQKPGSYRLKARTDGALFGYASAPNSIKTFLHPSEIRLFTIERSDGPFRILPNTEPAPRYAFIGVRGCDLAAMRVQDRILNNGAQSDSVYAARRRNCLIVAVHCTEPAETCFCTSMGTGPRAKDFDLALTQFADSASHEFLVEVGTEAGAALLDGLPWTEAAPELRELSQTRTDEAARHITRRLDPDRAHDLLRDNFESSQWEQVAARCLACGNCTMVCPTCFCVSYEETSDVTGQHAERWRKWDCCYSLGFSYIHGGSVRSSVKSRYRQWLTHKLSYWFEQFGSSGCVGCGRCITWCPVGIDITEEVKAIEAAASSGERPGERT